MIRNGQNAVTDLDIPMLHAPDRLPGEPDQVLSPTEFIAFTNQAGDPTGLGDDWGLIEEPIDTIDKSGFQLHGVVYTAAELIPFTTGDKKGPRPRLVARYDRAHAARGVLREVKVLRVLDGGQYDPLCVAVNRDRLKHDEAGRAEFLAFRREYLKVLMAKRKLSERAVLAFEEQENELKGFFDEQEAHQRQSLKVERSVSARVMVDGEGEGEESERSGVGEALQEADAAAATDTAHPSEAAEATGGTAEPSSTSTPVSAEQNGGQLGTALGGTTGFAVSEDDDA